MKMALCALLGSVFATAAANAAWTGDGQPLKYISSCELDLNNDARSDIVFLVETIQGRELIALLGEKAGYEAFFLWKGPNSNGMHLKCVTNRLEIKETSAAAGKSPEKTYKTNGAVIELFKPESSATSFFWEKGKFRQVVTAD